MSELEQARAELTILRAELTALMWRVYPAMDDTGVMLPDSMEELVNLQKMMNTMSDALHAPETTRFVEGGVRSDLLPQMGELWEQVIAASTRVDRLEGGESE